jgi:hypothetical protein
MNKSYILPAALLVAGIFVGFLAGVSFANHYVVDLSDTITVSDQFSQGLKLDVNVYVYKNGELVGMAHNIITNAGVGLFDEALHGPAGSSAAANARFIALTTDSTAPAYTDTTCPSEITSGGLARAEGTVTVTAGPANGDETVRVSKTFTATSSFTNVQKACLFTASSGGTLFAVATFSPVNLAANDQLTINWDFSYNN